MANTTMNLNTLNPSACDRRAFLRGLGVSLALPAFGSLLPARAFAAAPPVPATTSSGSPLRMVFLYVPNGVNTRRWRPATEGADYQLSPTLEPLAPFKQDFTLFSGLEQRNGTAGGDGAGDHARATASILTGARPRKTSGADIKLGVSVDQFAAQHVGHLTRFPSLELSCDGVRKSGVCDSGYSCAYQFNLSWRSETQPVAPESNPRLVFERLFGAGDNSEREKSFALRQHRQKSILDFVYADARTMHRQLGRNDQQKLDEYLTGVRAIEQRIQHAEKFGPLPDPRVPAPAGVPAEYQDHLRLMMDMLVLAFQTDSTRIATFLLAHDGSNRSFREVGVPEGHHYLSHHQDDPEKLEKIAKIDHFYTQQLAYFLAKMKGTADATGKSLLHNSMVVYCSGLYDGNRHQHSNLPVIVAGKAGGAFKPGRHEKFPSDVPMNNLYLNMLSQMGVKTERFGDSTGLLKEV
jgi:Protein of unknown function (DUF1552)